MYADDQFQGLEQGCALCTWQKERYRRIGEKSGGEKKRTGPCCLHIHHEDGSSKVLCWYPTTLLHDVTTQKPMT
jgi:hypothetical protein